MNNFERMVFADKLKKVADKQINERKAILEKEGWKVNLIEATNEMLYNVADEKAKKRYIISINVNTGKTIVEIRSSLKKNVKFEFNSDVKLITIFGYDDLIKEIGKEIEKYDI
ncbi:MAG: hypothetical protein ACRDDY_04230 [Clostridium sp.]|uniref:hypothetical protein n=1 Tax=Clostridium sp. TaxID=1506 RepID=UPI003EE4B56C